MIFDFEMLDVLVWVILILGLLRFLKKEYMMIYYFKIFIYVIR